MRNRAKCKLCSTTIESTHRHDYVSCACGEISIDGGQDYCRCLARNYSNFLRIDDEGNEIVVKFVDNPIKEENEGTLVNPSESVKYTKLELIEQLERLAQSIGALPQSAKFTHVTQDDMQSVIATIALIFRQDMP